MEQHELEKYFNARAYQALVNLAGYLGDTTLGDLNIHVRIETEHAGQLVGSITTERSLTGIDTRIEIG